MIKDRFERARGQPWPEADRLFRSDSRFLGSDDAYSIPLGGDRVLWMFGDTFVGDGTHQDRRKSIFIRNAIGIQVGLDPSNASISFHWSEQPGRPSSFFEERKSYWLWPMHGIRLDDKLVLFFMQVVPSAPGGEGGLDDWARLGALGFFKVTGWEALVVTNPGAEPGEWDVRSVPTSGTNGVIVGANLGVVDDHLVAHGWRDRTGYLARWPLEKAVKPDLSRPQWWAGTAGWTTAVAGAKVALPIAQTEFTVHEDQGFVHTQVDGLFGGSLCLRLAPTLSGPWSDPITVFQPKTPDYLMVYAGKAHPELTGADLVLTYATNLDDVSEVLDDNNVYFPHFVKVSL